MGHKERYDRNIRLLGASGQAKIEALRVAIVGLGGLGSHVAQQTAYLGVNKYALIDHDIVTESSLNRLLGASEDDVIARTLKVAVAKRVIAFVHPGAEVETIPEPVGGEAAKDAIQNSDVIFGCLDNDLSRLKVTELSAQYRKPYIDLATDVGEDQGQPWYGGRIVFATGGTLCLVCAGLLNQRDLARATMTLEQLEEDKRVYGVPVEALDGAGPSVVSLNGVVSSLAVTEFMVWASGLREPFPHLTYRGDVARITRVTDAPLPNCYYCKHLWHQTC